MTSLPCVARTAWCSKAMEPDDGEEEVLVGVSLASEAHVGDPSKDFSLGMITTRPRKCNLMQLRSQICIQIHTLPIAFNFLTRQGWPVTKSQETKVRVSQALTSEGVVRIHRRYEKPRIGVKTPEGQAIGFVFAEHSYSVSMLRNIVMEQLGHIGTPDGAIYQFLDRNNWPINVDQENSLAVIDVLVNGSVQVCSPMFSILRQNGLEEVDGMKALTEEPDLKRRRVDLRQVTFQSSKDQQRQVSVISSEETFTTKQVLISYVRAEAAPHALALKKDLIARDFSVYLDVHEIKSGIDWQDSLNFAVRNCEVFIPLVTPHYGETQWTNREVKLADVMSKLIVPVNFLDHWPPKCLAIQFATTQYIPWKKPGSSQKGADSSQHSDIRDWPSEDIEKVGQQLADRIRKHQRIQSVDSNASSLCKKVSMLRSYPSSLPDGLSQLSKVSEDREGPPLVVISVHPEQRHLASQLKTLFVAEGYEVWCSSEMVENIEDPEVIPSSPEGQAFDSTLMLSQGSHFSSQLSQMSDTEFSDQDKGLCFQGKADEAGIVIFVLSKAFAASKTSRQQVFYCEHRKRVINLRYEEFRMPYWMSMLIGTGVFEDARAEGYKESLCARIKRSLDPTARSGIQGEVCEGKVDYQAQKLRKRIPKDTYVYIAGGTKFFHKDSEAICQAIGKYLACLDNIHVVTGGFYGVGDTIGLSYHQERQRRSEVSNIWHVLPERDDQDRSRQGRQNKDKTFPMVPYGKTIYTGDSVREREMIVSRVFDMCILVEGGPGAAHEAEQFAWNDRVVIPVTCTGGAAGGKFNVPQKIFEIPLGVPEEDWSSLGNKDASSDEMGQTVTRIVRRVRERLRLDSPSVGGPPMSPLRLNTPRKRKTETGLSKMKTFVL